MDRNVVIQESLEQFTKRHLRTYAMMNSFFFTIENKTINRLFEIYIFNKFSNFEEYKQLRRLNFCKSILKNPRLIFADDAVRMLLAVCPKEWTSLITEEFEKYKSKAPMELKQLLRLKFLSYKQLENSNIFRQFHSEMINKTSYIESILSTIYVEIHTRTW